jgi:hypothetical protein
MKKMACVASMFKDAKYRWKLYHSINLPELGAVPEPNAD